MDLYEQKVRKYGPKFKVALDLTDAQVAGIFGNFAVETGKFKHMQELNPVVKGSKGGFGWAQWTGPRRRAYEQWAAEHNYDPVADDTNYLYTVWELQNTEAKALNMLKLTTTPKAAAETFCKHFERPGVPHMSKRIQYAEEAYRYLTTFSGQPQVEEKIESYTSFLQMIINFILRLFGRKN